MSLHIWGADEITRLSPRPTALSGDFTGGRLDELVYGNELNATPTSGSTYGSLGHVDRPPTTEVMRSERTGGFRFPERNLRLCTKVTQGRQLAPLQRSEAIRTSDPNGRPIV